MAAGTRSHADSQGNAGQTNQAAAGGEPEGGQVPEPPTPSRWHLDVYDRASEAMHNFLLDVDDSAAYKKLQESNAEIATQNRKDKIEPDLFQINLILFKSWAESAQNWARKLNDGTTNEAVKEKLRKDLETVRGSMEKNNTLRNFPAEWCISWDEEMVGTSVPSPDHTSDISGSNSTTNTGAAASKQEGGEPTTTHPNASASASQNDAGSAQEKAENPQGVEAKVSVITDEDLDLLRPESHQPIAGVKNPKKYRTVVTTKGRIGIIQFGPKNAPIYRREDITGSDTSEAPDITDSTQRPGEMFTYENRRKVWKLNKQSLISIQGVAFPLDAKLKQLDPSRKGSRPFVHTYVLIKCSDEGNVGKSWETRTVFRRLWGKQGKGPDWAIFEAAQYAERRFDEWVKGERRSESRSAAPQSMGFRANGARNNETDSESEDDDRNGRKFQRRKSRKSIRFEDETDESDEDVGGYRKRKPIRKEKGRSRKFSRAIDESDESDYSSEGDAKSSKAKKTMKYKPGRARYHSDEDEDNEETDAETGEVTLKEILDRLSKKDQKKMAEALKRGKL
ncbi:hypothetical protein MMC21_007880 [Puttea exsequens]|nr:hypothetical protein [Puttea exsequens]